jgi:hypothetical protein
VWWGVKKEEGIITQKKRRRRFERKRDIFTIKIKGSLGGRFGAVGRME